jgi:predicted RNase H-like HicB family nuclease
MYRFLVVIEKTDGNYSAYSPDLPGCVATGATQEEVERNMHGAIEMHVRGLQEDNLPIPESNSFAVYVSQVYDTPTVSTKEVTREKKIEMIEAFNAVFHQENIASNARKFYKSIDLL